MSTTTLLEALLSEPNEPFLIFKLLKQLRHFLLRKGQTQYLIFLYRTFNAPLVAVGPRPSQSAGGCGRPAADLGSRVLRRQVPQGAAQGLGLGAAFGALGGERPAARSDEGGLGPGKHCFPREDMWPEWCYVKHRGSQGYFIPPKGEKKTAASTSVHFTATH
jgi:hypothetical protein